MRKHYSIGLDYGTSSVRCVIVDVSDGSEAGSHVFTYPHGKSGVITDSDDANLARQHPKDYIDGFFASVAGALEQARQTTGFSSDAIIGIGVDTTGSSPLPVDSQGIPLAYHDAYADNTDALVWLWKDHTAHFEAGEITRIGRAMRPHLMGKIGNSYSSEWFWAKIWHCLKTNEQVFNSAYTWVEIADWIPAMLCGVNSADCIKRSVCAAGHKALYLESSGGYPDDEFLAAIDERLIRVKQHLPDKAFDISETAGSLDPKTAAQAGLPAGIPVAIGAFDAHLGGVGAGIRKGVLIKSMGTSSCDIMVYPLSSDLDDIPGLCGIVEGSVLPGYYGLEAGQSALGDIHGWFVDLVSGGIGKKETFRKIEEEASALMPGASGLLALDWMNGNRTILVDQRLSGLFIGMTITSTAAEMYRALLEASAFGARVIVQRFEEYGVPIDRIICCGGIPYKSPLLMQIYADILGKPMMLSRSAQTAALGAAVAGAVAAGPDVHGYSSYEQAMDRMTGTLETCYEPNPEHAAVYARLYTVYRTLHDTFGIAGVQVQLHHVMKELLDIKDEVRKS